MPQPCEIDMLEPADGESTVRGTLTVPAWKVEQLLLDAFSDDLWRAVAPDEMGNVDVTLTVATPTLILPFTAEVERL